MSGIAAKICGLNDDDALAAVARGGARFAGFVFYPPSPRAVTPGRAGQLAAKLPPAIDAVGVFVDPGDDLLGEALAQAPLAFLQLHGGESPARVAAIKARFAVPVIKAVAIADAADLAAARAYEPVADWLMFDAKAPKNLTNSLPGGNALAFDWRLLAGHDWSRPWLLSGGLRPENVAEAVAISGARAVDVSSGVEEAPGKKSPARITAFLNAVAQL